MRKIWLFNKQIDLWVLGLPVWASWLVCFFVPGNLLNQELPFWFWVIIILGIDVSHVWSTIFRTYLDKEEFNNHKKLLLVAPVVCLAGFFLIALVSSAFFWTVLAYLALYHFIKQQYGFMRLYQAKYGKAEVKRIISDKVAIYIGMLYPVAYWHLTSTRNFNWFINGDFFTLSSFPDIHSTALIPILKIAGNIIYFSILTVWLVQEVVVQKKHNLPFPTGKVLWIATTATNWFLGIVYFNSDFAFSLTNVVAHGVPYMALIFFYVEGKKSLSQTSKRPRFQIIAQVAIMLMVILALAFGEEYLWDMFLYRDNVSFFESIIKYPFEAVQTTTGKAMGLALLSLPQVTHYVLDGFIWKANKKNPHVKKVLLS